MRWFRLVLLLPIVLAGCGRVSDSEQLRLCRLVPPVLHPDGTEIREIRVTPASLGRSGLRVDYAAREPGAANRVHFVTCGFGGTDFRARPARSRRGRDRRGCARGGAAALSQALLADRGGARRCDPPTPQRLLEFPAAAAYALQQLVNAIALAAIYALLATAYSLIYGLVGRINLAFGEIAVLGAYGAIGGVAAAVALGIGDPILGLALAFVLAAAISADGAW